MTCIYYYNSIHAFLFCFFNGLIFCLPNIGHTSDTSASTWIRSVLSGTIWVITHHCSVYIAHELHVTHLLYICNQLGQCANEACAVCECEDGEIPDDLVQRDKHEFDYGWVEDTIPTPQDTPTSGQYSPASTAAHANVDRESAGISYDSYVNKI